MRDRAIPFYRPDISEADISEVVGVLRSGWITTGTQVQLFEEALCEWAGVERVLCVSSATAGLELVLRAFGIGQGDEVLTTPYTFAATANVIVHVGARPVFVDVKDDCTLDPLLIEQAITPRTKAIIPVDFAGLPAEYDQIYEALLSKKALYSPKNNTLQTMLERPLVLADAAHSLGARYNSQKSGSLADLSVFSFHAVKNLTTAEGGAITLKNFTGLSVDALYSRLKSLSQHGQDTDAFSRTTTKTWKYSIQNAGFKANMSDIHAALGHSQLKRYASTLSTRKKLVHTYRNTLSAHPQCIFPLLETPRKETSYHILPLRIHAFSETQRDALIQKLYPRVACNVHYLPVVEHPFYKRLGYRLSDYPRAHSLYQNEITLPLYTSLSVEDVFYVCKQLISALK